MDNDKEDSKSKNIIKTYFPNGILYCSAVYESNELVKCSRYHVNGKLAQNIIYQNRLILQKENFNRTGEKAETITFLYDNKGQIDSITQEKTNSIVTIIFNREDNEKITKIYIKQNNIVVRRIVYEYTKDRIECQDFSENEKLTYIAKCAPEANENWLNINIINSLVMRKLKAALELSA